MSALSASGLARAEVCAASAVLPHVASTSVAADRGREEHARREAAPPDGGLPEVAFALDMATGAARELGRGLARDYPATSPAEVVGTTDLVTVLPDRVRVDDYKTGAGYGVAPAARNPQLAFYAVCAAKVYGRTRATVRLIFTDQDDRIDSADLDEFDLAVAEARIRAIWRAVEAQRQRPVPVVSDHCRYCPAATTCPANIQIAHVVASGMLPDLLGGTAELTAQDAAHLMSVIVPQAKRVLGEAERACRAILATGPVRLPSGRMFGEREHIRRELDGRVAFQVLRDLHGPAVAEAAVSMETSQAALGAALALVAPPRGKAKLVREAMAAIEAAYGVTKKRTYQLEEWDQPKELSNGGAREVQGGSGERAEDRAGQD